VVPDRAQPLTAGSGWRSYPFVLTGPAIEKLRFVHDTIAAARVEVSRGSPSRSLKKVEMQARPKNAEA
jgi:hypothetical protein